MENKKNLATMRILMPTMAMDIGGAETHILELCRALRAMGHSITVASDGGAYVPQLEAIGVDHIHVPMRRRHPADLLKSYRLLKKMIRRGKFDVIHAHARIPAFLCSLILRPKKSRKKPKKKRPPFVTTAHFDFKTGGLAGKLTNWGQETLVVAPDIEQYLLENYAICSGQIHQTINGINTDTFAPQVSGETVRRELGIGSDATVIVHVSRLDKFPCMVAEQLIALGSKLCEKHKDCHIIIIGDGDQFARLSAEADRQNANLDTKRIHLIGKRMDIADCIAAGQLFVGVSRAALEAMSMEKPVLLAGHQGFAGMYNESKLALSRQTNFCYRGQDLPTETMLLSAIDVFFALSDAEKKSLGAYGRETIKTHYSTRQMAEDALSVYRKVERPKKILLSGYYGFQNAGDEAILHAFMKETDKLPYPVSVTVLSNNPAKTEAEHECRAVQRFRMFDVLRAVRRADVLVSGGGSLLQDKTSTRSILYYLTIIRLAKFFQKPVMIYANGVGPVLRPLNRRRMKNTVSRADIIAVREPGSQDELRQMGIDSGKIHVTADPIFAIDERNDQGAEEILNDLKVTTDKPLVGISIRRLRTDETFIGKMVKFADDIGQKLGAHVIFIAMHSPSDQKMSAQIQAQMQTKATILDCGKIELAALLSICAKLSLVFTMRLHTMLFAAKVNVPVLGLICDPKIEHYLAELNQPSAGEAEEFDPEQAFLQVKDMLNNRDNHKASLAPIVEEMTGRGANNTKLLGDLLADC